MTQIARKAYQTALVLNCDIYHLHDPELMPYGLKLKRKGKKVVFDSHEDYAEYISEKKWIPSIIRKPIASCFKCYQGYVLKRIDWVISVTPKLCDFLKQYNSKISIVTNFPCIDKNDSPTSRTKQRDVSPTLIFAGGVNELWSHEYILEALELVDKRVEYTVYGKADQEYLIKLKKMPNSDKFNYKGRVSHDIIASELERATIGMALCQYCKNTDGKNGTLGNTKLFEEMLAGLPVICTDFVLWKEIIEKYHCGFCVEPNNIEAIAEAIQYLVSNPEEAQRLGENGRQAIYKEFNWNAEAKKLVMLYRTLE